MRVLYLEEVTLSSYPDFATYVAQDRDALGVVPGKRRSITFRVALIFTVRCTVAVFVEPRNMRNIMGGKEAAGRLHSRPPTWRFSDKTKALLSG